MSRILIMVVVGMLISFSANAQTQFIKYKKYFIPISTTPNVYYIDDVDDSRQSNIAADPNGVLELPIVFGWKNLGHYNLVGVGADGPNGVSYNTSFTQSLLTLMGENSTEYPVLTGTALRDSIIDQARALGSPGNRLVIAIGGPRDIILDAIQHAPSRGTGTPINDLIRVIGIQACGSTPISNCPIITVGPAIKSAIGVENYHIVIDGTVQTPTFRWFYLPTFPHVGNRDAWYQTHYHQSAIGKYFRDNISNNTKLETEVKQINGDRLLRIADFTALAYLVWGDDIWSSEFETRMYSELEAGLATLP